MPSIYLFINRNTCKLLDTVINLEKLALIREAIQNKYFDIGNRLNLL